MAWVTSVRGLLTYAVLVRLLTITLLLAASSRVPSFDKSALLLLPPSHHYLEPFVRWDTLYFVKIAFRGYQNEQELAFTPGLPLVMRIVGMGIRLAKGQSGAVEVPDVVMGGLVACFIAGVGATLALYKLSLELTRDKSFALLAASLFLIPASPATLNAVPYTEVFSALFTFVGMLYFLRRRLILASLFWSVGSIFRAQGIVLGVGFFGWHYILVRPFLGGRFSVKTLVDGVPKFVGLSMVSVAPFLLYQAWAYTQFCPTEGLRRPWCDEGLGSSYGWVQREYWNVGPFRYWTLLQLPNFAFAAPLLFLSFSASYTFYSHNLHHVLTSTLPFLPLSRFAPKSTIQHSTPFLSPHLTPFIHLHTALTLLLFFASHVQIILRVSATNPIPFLYASHLLSSPSPSGRKWGGRWVRYCIYWGGISIVLWAGFYPPA